LGALAEELGYDTIWVTDSPLIWRELYVNLSAIACHTERVRLGSAVTTGVTRHPAVTASAAASLAELTDGRFCLGLGTGDSSLLTTGGRPQTLAEFRRTVTMLRALLAGDRWAAGSKAELELAWAKGAPVPLYVAASGPRMLELAGEVADGVIMMVGVQEARIRAAMERVKTAALAAGRDADAMEFVLWTACAVSDHAPREAVEAVRAHVARAMIRTLPLPVASDCDAVVERIRAQYDYAVHGNSRAPHARLVPDALIPEFAIAGTTEQCAEQLGTLGTLGLHEIALAVPDAAFDDRGTILARLKGSVLPSV
ncbi:MAG: LLM class flavin-dependent oxidoreductase, partial [Alphaproteobacteria bacterium]